MDEFTINLNTSKFSTPHPQPGPFSLNETVNTENAKILSNFIEVENFVKLNN